MTDIVIHDSSVIVVNLAPWLAGGLALVACGILLWRMPRLRGTTLVAPWVWSLVSILTLAATEVLVAWVPFESPTAVASLRFAAAMSSFCPLMAVLGAKRPQDRGWQVIVLSLWGVLCVPGLHWYLVGGYRELHAAWFGFIVILLVVGIANGVGTRNWPAALVTGAAQLALVWPFFQSTYDAAVSMWTVLGMAGLTLAWLLQGVCEHRRSTAALPLDRVWLDFRDAFGVVWALRILERTNASATMVDWPVMLSWRGFVPRTSDHQFEIPPAVEESLRTLLRRFVSPEWIDQRSQG